MANLARLFRAAALTVSFAAVSAYGALPAVQIPPSTATTPVSAPLEPVDLGQDIADFYRERGFQPVWVSGSSLRPEVAILLRSITPDAQLAAALRNAASGQPNLLARADLLLTKAYADHVLWTRRPPSHNVMTYVDEELKPRAPALRDLLNDLSSTPALGQYVHYTTHGNPVLDGLQRGLALYRDQWSGLPQFRLAAAPDTVLLNRRLGLTRATQFQVAQRLREFQQVHGLPRTGRPDPATIAALNRGADHYERLIEINIDRARAIRARPRGRYVLVDTASARLWLIEHGGVRDQMRAIVGTPQMQTPVMAGMMRHVVLNPYWNLPPDLIRKRARNAVRQGARAITDERLQVLSDWSDEAKTLDPNDVNWNAVASGRELVNLRQRPGPQNMMGAIKFMFPNDLGIYLHDTPFKTLFSEADRRLSSGCVRVEDAARLARWVFGGNLPHPSGAAEEEVSLPEPVPVYIAYFTALPTRAGVVFQSDIYGRDRIRRGSTRDPASRARF